MSAAHTVFVRTIIKVFFIIFLKDLWMVISLQSLSFPPILLFFLCPAPFVSVCVDAVLSSQVPLTLPADVTEHVRGERNEKHQRLFEASLLHLLYMNNASASVAFRKKKIHIGQEGSAQRFLSLPSPIIPIIPFNERRHILKFRAYSMLRLDPIHFPYFLFSRVLYPSFVSGLVSQKTQCGTM